MRCEKHMPRSASKANLAHTRVLHEVVKCVGSNGSKRVMLGYFLRVCKGLEKCANVRVIFVAGWRLGNEVRVF